MSNKVPVERKIAQWDTLPPVLTFKAEDLCTRLMEQCENYFLTIDGHKERQVKPDGFPKVWSPALVFIGCNLVGCGKGWTMCAACRGQFADVDNEMRLAVEEFNAAI